MSKELSEEMAWVRGYLANIILSSLTLPANNGTGSLPHEVAKMPYGHLNFVQRE